MPLIFGLLVIINAVFLAWQFYEKQNAGQSVVAQEQIPGKQLQLLSEKKSNSEKPNEEQVNTPKQAAASGTSCFRIGPLQDELMAERLRTALINNGFEVRVESFSQDQSGYLVYIPPQATREKAQQLAVELASRGLDASVVSDPQFANAVALGTYQSSEQAGNLRGKLAGMGYQAEIRQTGNVRKEQWLKVESAGSTAKSQIERLISGTPKIRREPAACEN